MFIGRKNELATLENEYRRQGSSFVVIYGRRRVGKTTLIREFIKDKDSIYFIASEEIENENKKEFQQEVFNHFNMAHLNNVKFENWDGIFKTMPETKEKLVMVIDEFQYLCMSNSAFSSIFQRIWDGYLKERNIMVILCGSYISMMEAMTLSYNSPLYGRRTAQIKLGPLSFKESCLFYPELTFNEKILTYSITGGIPKYLEIFNNGTDIFESIKTNIINKGSFLHEEPYFLLQKEVEHPLTYFSILKSIASGNRKMGNIASNLSLASAAVGKYLSVLQQLDIVERRVPVTEENPEKSKKGLYYIKDNFINFWFKFIFPYKNYIEMDRNDYLLNLIRRDFVDTYAAFIFEDVCSELLWERELPFEPLKVGRWWNSTSEIDLVAVNPFEKKILFAECKYWEGKVGIYILKELKEKSRNVDFFKEDREEYFMLFSKNGYTDELYDLEKKGEVTLW